VSSKFDQIHMETAWAWARFGTCQRLRVGAVLALDERIVASGYNGAPKGLPHCTHDLSAPFDYEDRCKNAVHAEANVIAFAARRGRSTDGTTLYITHAPCYSCSGLLISAGIVCVIYREHYRSVEGLVQLEKAGIEVKEY
jgi:dCMP deaminase